MYKNRLKNLRELNEITQDDISSILNIARGRYSHYENENELLPIKYLNVISNYFNVSVDYLFEFTDTLKYKKINKNIIKDNSGKRLKEFRKENKLTQEKLAFILNVGQSTIAEYERGTNLIATPFLYTICKKYKVSADYLLGKIDSPKYLK